MATITLTRSVPTVPRYFDILRYRRELPRRFSDIPLTSDRDGFMARSILQAGTVLEIGAGERPFSTILRGHGWSGEYRAMDLDGEQDYYGIEDIDWPCEAIIMREVAEHLERDEFYVYLARFRELLLPGGKLVLSTPNPWSPGCMLADYTHISHWPPHDMYGVLRSAGFNRVSITRVIWPSRWLWLKRAYWRLHSTMYDVDFAGAYIAVAQ